MSLYRRFGIRGGAPEPKDTGVKNTRKAFEVPARRYAPTKQERQTNSSDIGPWISTHTVGRFVGTRRTGTHDDIIPNSDPAERVLTFVE